MTLVPLVSVAAAWAGDRVAVPDPIASAVAREWPGARILEVEHEDGAVEVELAIGEERTDVLFRADGTWIERKAHVAVADLPEAVRAAAAREGRVTEAERRTTPDGRTDWELEVRARKGSRVLHLDDAGRILRSADDEDGEDDDDDE